MELEDDKKGEFYGNKLEPLNRLLHDGGAIF